MLCGAYVNGALRKTPTESGPSFVGFYELEVGECERIDNPLYQGHAQQIVTSYQSLQPLMSSIDHNDIF